jgi:hypothetical protein
MTDRVILRRPGERDAEVVASLLASVPAVGLERAERVVVERSGNVVGVVESARNQPKRGWLTFGAIVMAEGERGWGYGSEAVRLVEASSGARRFRAAVPKSLGLAFYFWLRQGYRPAAPGEAFWPADGADDIIWVVREQNQRT